MSLDLSLVGLVTQDMLCTNDIGIQVLKRSHIGAAGMRSELTFERGGTVVVA